MSLMDTVEMVENWDLRMRLLAAAAQEVPGDTNKWVSNNVFRVCGADGWDTAWQAATGDRPGADPTVITDEMIRDSVRAVVAAEDGPTTHDEGDTADA